jgi:hypothetical protein
MHLHQHRVRVDNRAAGLFGSTGMSSVSIRSRIVALPRQYRFHSAFFRRSSSRVANLPKNSSRFIRFIGTTADASGRGAGDITTW